METFQCKTKIISGPGAVSALGQMGLKRIFLVSDPYFVRSGQAQQVAQLAGEDCRVFDRVKPDPTVELAAQATAQVKEFAPDAIVALGGGSAMDLAKALRHFSGSGASLIAIPTTSGSGSEVTDFAVLTHNGCKHPLVEESLRPDVAVLDSDLLQQLPGQLVADTGFDLLSHALESYVATGAGSISRALAEQAFCTAYALLPASFAGEGAVRRRIHQASCMAGMAFSQSGLGLCHALAHALGGAFHVPHGRLNAILLPAVICCNAHVAGELYARIARQAGMGGSARSLGVRNLKNGLISLRQQLGLPQTLAQAGIDPDRVRAGSAGIVQATLADPCCKTNPLPVEDYMVRRILEEVTGRV